MKGNVVIFSAPSGAGKTTIVKHLLKKKFNLEFSVSATCRLPRPNEINGKDYYFLTEKKIKEKIKNDEFLEWEEVYNGIYYGTLKSEVERIRNNGKNVIFDVDVVGALNIKKYYGDNALSIFVKPPSVEELRNRLQYRSTEPEDKINMRIKKAEHEMSFANKFDVIIINDELAKAKADAERILTEFLIK